MYAALLTPDSLHHPRIELL
jgi:hypothetical protein